MDVPAGPFRNLGGSTRGLPGAEHGYQYGTDGEERA